MVTFSSKLVDLHLLRSPEEYGHVGGQVKNFWHIEAVMLRKGFLQMLAICHHLRSDFWLFFEAGGEPLASHS